MSLRRDLLGGLLVAQLASRVGSFSVPAITWSAACRSDFGNEPDFIPKYTACGWWATIASVDCSGSTA